MFSSPSPSPAGLKVGALVAASGLVTMLLAPRAVNLAPYGGPTVGDLTWERPATPGDLALAGVPRGFGTNAEGVRILLQEVR